MWCISNPLASCVWNNDSRCYCRLVSWFRVPCLELSCCSWHCYKLITTQECRGRLVDSPSQLISTSSSLVPSSAFLAFGLQIWWTQQLLHPTFQLFPRSMTGWNLWCFSHNRYHLTTGTLCIGESWSLALRSGEFGACHQCVWAQGQIRHRSLGCSCIFAS